MKIPLVSQYAPKEATTKYLKSGTGMLAASGQGLFSSAGIMGGGSIKIQGSEQGITKNLSEKLENLSDIDTDNLAVEISGYIGSALNEILRIGTRIKELNAKLENTEQGQGLNESLNQEISYLKNEIGRIVNSDQFKDALGAGQSVNSSMQHGVVSRRSLSGASGLLGDQFLNMVAGGKTGAVSQVVRGLEKLSSLAGGDSSDLAIKEIMGIAKNIIGVLKGKTAEEVEEQEEEGSQKPVYIHTPKASEASYGVAGNIALSFKSYQGKDLIRAVAMGTETRAEDLLQLSIKMPDSKEDKKEVQKKREAQKDFYSGLQNGVRLQ
jgi:flagellin-like hook-associated protein FlgL